MPSQRQFVAATLAAAAALPLATEGTRVQSMTAQNWTSEVAVPAMFGSMSVQEAWDTFNNYVGHKHVMTFVTAWTLNANLNKIMTIEGQKSAARTFEVTGEIFTTLEALMEVDKTFTKVLGIKTEEGSAAWNCSQFKSTPPKLQFTSKGFLLFPIGNFETMNELTYQKQCLTTVENHINAVRWGICWLEDLATAWVKETAESTKDPAFFGEMYKFDSTKLCDGDALDEKLLSNSFRANLEKDDSQTCVTDKGSLRMKDCATECARIEECTAVTHESKHGRRCCFFSGDIDEVTEVDGKASFWRRLMGKKKQHADEKCLVLSGRDRFLMKSVDDVGEWLEKRGFKNVKGQAASFGGVGLNGMSISFLTAPLLNKYLSSEGAPLKNAEELRCLIDAELENDAIRDCTKYASLYDRITGLSPVSKTTFDNSLIVPKGAKGKHATIKWVLDFGRRFSPQKDLKAWSSGFYEVVSFTMNSQAVIAQYQKGFDSLTPLVMLKAATAATGVLKFVESTDFTRCRDVKHYLDLVVDELMSKPMSKDSQMDHVRARVAHGA